MIAPAACHAHSATRRHLTLHLVLLQLSVSRGRALRIYSQAVNRWPRKPSSLQVAFDGEVQFRATRHAAMLRYPDVTRYRAGRHRLGPNQGVLRTGVSGGDWHRRRLAPLGERATPCPEAGCCGLLVSRRSRHAGRAPLWTVRFGGVCLSPRYRQQHNPHFRLQLSRCQAGATRHGRISSLHVLCASTGCRVLGMQRHRRCLLVLVSDGVPVVLSPPRTVFTCAKMLMLFRAAGTFANLRCSRLRSLPQR